MLSKSNESDSDKTNGGTENMEQFGFTSYMCRNTIYGDWSCTTDTEKILGEFCADSRMVGVFLLEEVLKYNPEFDYHITRPWTTTVIKDFHGEVSFDVKTIEGIYEENTEYWKKGEKWEERTLEVVGTGNINFFTRQTGL